MAKQWYVVHTLTGKENKVKASIEKMAEAKDLSHLLGRILVPTETEIRSAGGQRREVKRKLYPGYLVVHMVVNDETWFLVRETPGIGDFTGAAGRPTPMLPHEVARILARQEEKADEAPKLKIAFSAGDRVKINEGTFENFEGEVHTIDETNGRVTVMINIFGRSTPVELEYWQIESI